MVVLVTPEIDGEFWLSAEYFASAARIRASLVQPNLPQLVRNNKTVGLVAREGAVADGN
jgi:hypothetical protein